MQNSGCFFREYPIKICSHDFMFLDLMLSGISKALLVYFWITETILLVETTYRSVYWKMKVVKAFPSPVSPLT